MSALRSAVIASIALLMPLAAKAEPPFGQLSGRGPVVNTQSTYCDYRGCFGFGPRQWHRPSYVQPNYRPPTARGPTYYQPRTQARPQLSYDPPPIRTLRPAAKDPRMHVEWCRNQYRTYNPQTDRFVTYRGIYKTCNSPFD